MTQFTELEEKKDEILISQTITKLTDWSENRRKVGLPSRSLEIAVNYLEKYKTLISKEQIA